MPSIQVSQQINAPAEDVFAHVTRLRDWPEVISAIDKIEVLTDGPIGVGTKFIETRTLFGKAATEEMTFSEFVPPTHYALKAESHGSIYDSRFDLESNDAGTLVTMTFQATPVSLFAKVMGVVMMPIMKKTLIKCVGQDLLDLKASIEKI